MRYLSIILLLLAGCASSGQWGDLVQDATPTFRTGPCGPELVWTKEVAVYDTAVVEGRVVVKKKCVEPSE